MKWLYYNTGRMLDWKTCLVFDSFKFQVICRCPVSICIKGLLHIQLSYSIANNVSLTKLLNYRKSSSINYKESTIFV